MDKLPELTISGIGKSNGGKFAYVDISGMGTILGAVDAGRISISGKGTIEGDVLVSGNMNLAGMATIRGSLRGRQILSSGNGSITGMVEAERVESSGNMKIEGPAKIKELSNAGRCRVELNLMAQKVESYGFLSVGGDVEAEEFYSQGSFTIGGLLNANKIDIRIHGFCQAREIGGEEIQIRHGHSFGFVSKLISSFLGTGRELDKLKADLIEGTVVSLEYTKADVVRGQKVIVGPACLIREVEYTDSIEIDPSAVVQKQTKA